MNTKKELKKTTFSDVKLLLWDVADFLSKNEIISLETFNKMAIKNNITPKKRYIEGVKK